jgi:hypothetical protein
MAQFSKIKPGSCFIPETQRTEQSSLVQPQITRFARLELASTGPKLVPEQMLHQGELMRISRHQKQMEAKILERRHRSDLSRDAIPVSPAQWIGQRT